MGFESALIGYIMNADLLPIAVYDYQKALEVLTANDDMEYLDAVEYLEFNVLSAGLGERTPLWVYPADTETLKEVEGMMNS
jgi:hypothetical protein